MRRHGTGSVGAGAVPSRAQDLLGCFAAKVSFDLLIRHAGKIRGGRGVVGGQAVTNQKPFDGCIGHGIRCRYREGIHPGGQHDRAAEKIRAQGRHHQIHNIVAAGGLPADNDFIGITAEGRDVVPDPGKRLEVIKRPVVSGLVRCCSGRSQRRMRQETHGRQAILNKHDNNIAAGGQGRALVLSCGAEVVGAAVDVNENRKSCLCCSRAINIQIKAVFTALESIGRAPVLVVDLLCAVTAGGGGVACACPRIRIKRRFPAQGTDRRFGVRHAFPGPGVFIVGITAHDAESRRYRIAGSECCGKVSLGFSRVLQSASSGFL